jgi:hypothetical protein
MTQMRKLAYDPIGLHPNWLGHLDWLGSHAHQSAQHPKKVIGVLSS